jgi:streptomycin 6-kinase
MAILKEELPFDWKEIQGWAFAYTMMSTAWSVTDHGEIPRSHIEILEILDTLSNAE